MSEAGHVANLSSKRKSIESRLSDVEARMYAVENTHQDYGSVLYALSAAVGEPEDGDRSATGLYRLIDSVGERLSWFERLREQAKGACWAFGFGLPSMAALTWFLAGHKITALFHG